MIRPRVATRAPSKAKGARGERTCWDVCSSGLSNSYFWGAGFLARTKAVPAGGGREASRHRSIGRQEFAQATAHTLAGTSDHGLKLTSPAQKVGPGGRSGGVQPAPQR